MARLRQPTAVSIILRCAPCGTCTVLALVLWLGGMTIAGFVVAPTTFGVLEAWNPSTGRVLAGQVFGAVLASRVPRRVYRRPRS